jgi:pimeloyl-ACP methyl ester carboxylesterase
MHHRLTAEQLLRRKRDTCQRRLQPHCFDSHFPAETLLVPGQLSDRNRCADFRTYTGQICCQGDLVTGQRGKQPMEPFSESAQLLKATRRLLGMRLRHEQQRAGFPNIEPLSCIGPTHNGLVAGQALIVARLASSSLGITEVQAEAATDKTSRTPVNVFSFQCAHHASNTLNRFDKLQFSQQNYNSLIQFRLLFIQQEDMHMVNWPLEHEYRFRGQMVRYAVRGTGPALVFVHGTPFSSYVWHRLVPHFVESHQVYWFDLLGYGQSEQAEGQDVSLGVQGELLAELLEHWGLERPDVVAHDFGGATALRAHLLHGKSYRSLTLIDPVALAPWGSPFVQHVRQHETAFRGLPAYIHQAIVPAYVRGAVYRAIPDSELAPYVQPWLGDTGQAAFYRQIAQMDQRYTEEMAPRYGEIDCPTLILWGEEDQWIPIERGRQLQQAIPGAGFAAIANSGHLVQEDAPEAIVAALLGFLPLIGRSTNRR